jgi:hypothetical protein
MIVMAILAFLKTWHLVPSMMVLLKATMFWEAVILMHFLLLLEQ